jgi:hypothetical protein
MMRILLAASLCLGIASPAKAQVVADTVVVSDSFHLTGPNVVRHRPIGLTKQRVLLVGVRLPNGGCHFVGHGPRVAGWSQWEEEVDYDTCRAIHGQGPGDGGPHLDLKHSFKDSLLLIKGDTAGTQAVRKTKKP